MVAMDCSFHKDNVDFSHRCIVAWKGGKEDFLADLEDGEELATNVWGMQDIVENDQFGFSLDSCHSFYCAYTNIGRVAFVICEPCNLQSGKLTICGKIVPVRRDVVGAS